MHIVGDVFAQRPGWVADDAGLWAPDIEYIKGQYYLYYTASNTDLPGGGSAIGPGGQDIVVDDDGETWIVYHSWDRSAAYRAMQIDELVWEGDTPVVKGPDKGPQPIP